MKSSVIIASPPTEHEKMALQRMEDMFPPQNHIVIFGPLVPMRNGGNKGAGEYTV